jgi:hypothetical protein
MSKITGAQGSHDKPIGCGASGAYAPGPDDKKEETWSYLNESNQQQIISEVV